MHRSLHFNETPSKQGKHTFRSLSSIDKAIEMATSVGGVLSTGRFVNTSNAIQKDLTIQLAEDSPLDQDWYAKGCYNRPKRKPIQRISGALKKDLEEIFEKGILTNNKLSALKAVTYLKEMRNPDGRLKYSFNPTNPNGPPPDEIKVKQYFSNLSVKYRRGPVAKEKNMTSPQIEVALQERNLPHSPPLIVLRTILYLCDRLDIADDEQNEKENEEIVDYADWRAKELEAEIQRRGLTLGTRKERLQLLLHLYDTYNEGE